MLAKCTWAIEAAAIGSLKFSKTSSMSCPNSFWMIFIASDLGNGGRFICLEFSKVQNEDLSKLYRAYSKIIPIFGKIIVGDEKPYKYLTETIENFPSQENFKNIVEESNFSNVKFRNLFNGVVAIHSGWK